MEEIWKDIKGFEGLYKISNTGKILSLKYKNGRKPTLKKPNLCKEGYYVINLCKDYKNKICRVHRLIAEAFIPNPENKPQVDHINAVRTDNRIENLRWVTNFENSRNPITYEKIKKNGREKIELAKKACMKKIRCVETGKIYDCRKQVIDELGGEKSSITRPLQNKNRTFKKLHWEYINESVC